MSRTNQVSFIAEWLERRILAGELSPGDSLPSEREISADLGVSRSVVREALGRLSSLGLVSSHQGLGTFVSSPDGRAISVGYQRLLELGQFRHEHLASVRLPLETTIARLAARYRTDEHLVDMERAQQILGSKRRALNDLVAADLAFHAVLARATGNPLFHVVLAPIQELLLESRRLTLKKFGADIAHGHHEIILQAVRDRDEERAALGMQEHLITNFEHLRAESTPESVPYPA